MLTGPGDPVTGDPDDPVPSLIHPGRFQDNSSGYHYLNIKNIKLVNDIILA